jgi:outer membrane protein assembly factor BamB
MRRRALTSIVALALLAAIPSVSPAATLLGAPAVAYQGGVTHDGNLQDTGLRLPLSVRWVHHFFGVTGYALIADGLVFVPETNTNAGFAKRVYALDAATGAEVWSQPVAGTYGWLGIAYDGGQIFVVNYDGLVRSLDGATGEERWSAQMPNQYSFSAPPTADNGILYIGGAGSGGTLYAVDETDGTILWSTSVGNGDRSSPALSDDDVFVSYACPQTYSFDRLTGSSNWHFEGPCSGGGGKTAAYYGGRLYVRDVFFGRKNGLALDAATGTIASDFRSDLIPALHGTTGFFSQDGRLVARDLQTKEPLWRFQGDGMLRSAPLVVDDLVFVGSRSGMLYGLDVTTGRTDVSMDLVTGIRRPDEQGVRRPITGFNAGEGILVIPAAHRLYALD